MNNLAINNRFGTKNTFIASSFTQQPCSDVFGIGDYVKHFIYYKDMIAYAVSNRTKYSCGHDHYIVLITLAAVRDLHWTLSGNFGESFDAPAGSVLIIPHNTDYTLHWPAETEFIQIALDASMLENLRDITRGLSLEALFPHPTRLPNSKILLLANLLRAELIKNAPVSGGYIAALLSVLMVQLVQNHSFLNVRRERQENRGLSYQASRRIEAYLRENYMRKLSVARMAGVLGISGGHFLTSFRESFGVTPHQYLLALRLNAAEEMLTETDICLAEVAERAGFSSQSHLTTALKKSRLTTPGELRRKRNSAAVKS